MSAGEVGALFSESGLGFGVSKGVIGLIGRVGIAYTGFWQLDCSNRRCGSRRGAMVNGSFGCLRNSLYNYYLSYTSSYT